MTTLTSRPLHADDFPLVEVWFDDPEVVRWLGDRAWPRRLLRLAAASNRHAVLFMKGDDPVALLDLEREDDGTAAIACVVAPPLRRQGVGTSILRSLLTLPETEGVTAIVGEAEDGNDASERLLRSAGFVLDARTEQGFNRYVLRR